MSFTNTAEGDLAFPALTFMRKARGWIEMILSQIKVPVE